MGKVRIHSEAISLLNGLGVRLETPQPTILSRHHSRLARLNISDREIDRDGLGFAGSYESLAGSISEKAVAGLRRNFSNKLGLGFSLGRSL
jgi:hypothetical protein